MRKHHRLRRGASLMWVVAALGLASAMTPLFVSMCHSLTRLTARGGHRLIATQRGTAELERLRSGERGPGEFAVPELPSGQATVRETAGPAPGLRQVELRIAWDEHGSSAQAVWTTLVAQKARAQ